MIVFDNFVFSRKYQKMGLKYNLGLTLFNTFRNSEKEETGSEICV